MLRDLRDSEPVVIWMFYGFISGRIALQKVDKLLPIPWNYFEFGSDTEESVSVAIISN